MRFEPQPGQPREQRWAYCTVVVVVESHIDVGDECSRAPVSQRHYGVRALLQCLLIAGQGQPLDGKDAAVFALKALDRSRPSPSISRYFGESQRAPLATKLNSTCNFVVTQIRWIALCNVTTLDDRSSADAFLYVALFIIVRVQKLVHLALN